MYNACIEVLVKLIVQVKLNINIIQNPILQPLDLHKANKQ